MEARSRIYRDRCLHVPDEEREPVLLSPGRMHSSPPPRGAASTGDHHPRRSRLGSSVDSGPAPPSHRPADQVALQSGSKGFRLPELESNLFQDIWLIAEDIGLQKGYVKSLLAAKKPAYSSRWSKYKAWCYQTLHHPFVSTYPCLLYTSPSPRDGLLSRMPSSA